uniref:aminoacyl-tRNA hydrolase n=1 Tax=Pararhizobium sp. IMCC3301 TaxID=3067904 RepID=UPI0027405753|nr:aminoacyl-tRNA hydrolase [Pararhizobium sp. IMCC3301]
MKLLVGLGNPGLQYARNRHNIGFHTVDEIQSRHGFTPWRDRFQGWVATGTLNDEKATLLKPATYMNESGRSVGEAMRYFKIPLDDLIVFYDELDLAPAKVRVKTGGGAGGHNGIRSIDAHIGNEYQRVRIGIGHPGHKNLVSRYVLSDFAKADAEWLELLIGSIADAVPTLLKDGSAGFLNELVLRQKPETERPDRLKSAQKKSSKATTEAAALVKKTGTNAGKKPVGPMAAALKALLPKTRKD